MPMFERFNRGFSIVVLAAFLAATTGCLPGPRLKKRNVDQVMEGMTKKQVESILGPPTVTDQKDWTVLKKTTYYYKQGTDTVTIVFRDDKVQSKESTLVD